jgi:lipopolysaccharide transport system permease protein
VPESAAAIPQVEAWIIEPQRTGLIARVAELWAYRRVLWFLASRAVTERYEGTVLGKFWLFARPLMPILIGGIVFGSFLRIPSEGVPFVLFYMTGVVPWNLFDRSVLMGTKCLEQDRNLLKKLYFPRLISPVASMAPAVIDFTVYLGLLAGMLGFYWIKDGVLYLRLDGALAIAPMMMLLAVFCALSVILWTCVLQVRYKDVRFTLRYVMQLWMYMTPVFYPISVVPAEYRWLLYVNPLASVVTTFRWAVIGVGEVPVGPLIAAVVWACAALAAGLWFFTASEASTIDRL